ncbi:hypothetical protein [Azospirillum brasilense]|uniref:hypothetical protein n=1 Tax=Azospirillum brasilense TaxID=192 RepID=UPI0011C3466A|nr:hypothetical protein [Azospirillum brasilense]NUB25279.1 hypothetical protein [Azospirillum brasilense]NUB30650.1 hypothetical protein [Azospirillum brasilense]
MAQQNIAIMNDMKIEEESMTYHSMLCVFSLASVVALSGCQTHGMGTVELPNVEIPKTFEERDFIRQADLYGDNINQLVGRILVKRGDRLAYGRRVIKGDAGPVTSLEQNPPVYRSVVDRRFDAETTLPFLKANLKNNERAEIVIHDVARISVPPDNIPEPRDLLRMESSGGISDTRIFYIEGVLLSTIDRTRFSSSGAGGTGVIPYLTIGGETYQQVDGQSRSYAIALILQDVQLLAEVSPPSRPMPAAVEGVTGKLSGLALSNGIQAWPR